MEHLLLCCDRCAIQDVRIKKWDQRTAASSCSLASVDEALQFIKKESSFKLTKNKLVDSRYSVAIADMSDIGQGRQICEVGEGHNCYCGLVRRPHFSKSHQVVYLTS